MSVVCIAPAAHLKTLLKQEKGARGFSDTDALRALRLIIDLRPDTVVVETSFAATARGSALVQRIKGEAALAGCIVQLVDCDGDAPALPVTRTTDSVATAAAAPDISVSVQVDPVVDAPPEPPPASPGDTPDLRRAPRFRMQPAATLTVDGKPVALVNLSTIGAQVVSAVTLKPRQRVRVLFPKVYPPVPTLTSVIWASFEITTEGPRYRAGLEFLGGNAAAIERFRDQHQH